MIEVRIVIRVKVDEAALKARTIDKAAEEFYYRAMDGLSWMDGVEKVAGNYTIVPVSDFCRYCGASIPPRLGEGTCQTCNPPTRAKP
jgi:hypothetical protein